LLHRGSRISFGNFPAARRIRLLTGEAHFTVSKTSAQPFIVHADQVTIRDLGTAFDVRLDFARVAVLVTEGSVAVSNLAATAATTNESQTLLTVGQRAIVQTASPVPIVEVAAPASHEIEAALAWKSHRLSFERTPLADALVELNRYNVAQLAVGDPAIATDLIAGSVQSDNLDGFVRLLESGFGITAERRGRDIILRRAK
jgi:transmembrane sensor